jgi:HPt (histidine-containing phosphotransfer) domain-containing protein
MYDLGLLEELDDKEAMLDILALFLRDTPLQVQELLTHVKKQHWESVSQLAHKLKGAVSMLQVTTLVTSLMVIEKTAQSDPDKERVADLVTEVAKLFKDLQEQLVKETDSIRKELGLTGSK